MENKTERSIHRVGTMTSGIALIVFGILFLLHMIVPTVNFLFIFRLWPVILIMLGIEILIGNFKKSAVFVYDKGSVVLMIILMFFAFVMGIMNEWFLHIPSDYIQFHW